MTENEAKGMLQAWLTCRELEDKGQCIKNCDECNYCYAQGTVGEHKKAVEMAIQALDEIQQYRAIGTVEEFKALKVKNEPKKPIITNRQYRDGEEVEVEWKCPICGLNVIEEPPCQEYCQRCGNKLDWSE